MTRFRSMLGCAAAIAALGLVSCAAPFNGPEAVYDQDMRYPITVAPHMETLRLPLRDVASPADIAASGQLARFARDYLDQGAGSIALSGPAGNAGDVNNVVERLTFLGVPRNRIMLGGGNAGENSADIRLTYIRYTASAPACGDWSKNLGDTASNTVSANFGCATQRNIAAMISDPRDLVMPQPLDPDDAQRRLIVLEKYRKGETTITEKSKAQSGAVSTAAGSDK